MKNVMFLILALLSIPSLIMGSASSSASRAAAQVKSKTDAQATLVVASSAAHAVANQAALSASANPKQVPASGVSSLSTVASANSKAECDASALAIEQASSQAKDKQIEGLCDEVNLLRNVVNEFVIKESLKEEFDKFYHDAKVKAFYASCAQTMARYARDRDPSEKPFSVTVNLFNMERRSSKFFRPEDLDAMPVFRPHPYSDFHDSDSIFKIYQRLFERTNIYQVVVTQSGKKLIDPQMRIKDIRNETLFLNNAGAQLHTFHGL